MLYKNILFLFLFILLTGCSARQPVKTNVVQKIEKVEVRVPIKPKRPKINCEFSGSGTIPTTKLIECIILQKKIIDELTEE